MKNYIGGFKDKFRDLSRKTLFVLLGSVFVLLNFGLFSTPLNAYASDDGLKIEGFNDYIDVEQCNYSLTGTDDVDKESEVNKNGKTFNCITLQNQNVEGNDFSYIYANQNLNEFDYYEWQTDDPIASNSQYLYYDGMSLAQGEYNGQEVYNLNDEKFLSKFKNYMIYKVMKFTPNWTTSVKDGNNVYTFSTRGDEIFFDSEKDQYSSYYRYNANGELEFVYNKYAEFAGGEITYLPTNEYWFGGDFDKHDLKFEYNEIKGLHNEGYKLQEFSQYYITVDRNGNEVGSPEFDDSSYVRNDNGVINFYIWDSSEEKFYIYNVHVVEDNNWVTKDELDEIYENGNQVIFQKLEDKLIAKTKEYRDFNETIYELTETIEIDDVSDVRDPIDGLPYGKFKITEEKYIPSITTDDSYATFDVEVNPLSYDMVYDFEFEYITDKKYDYTVEYRQQNYEYSIVDKEKIDNYETLDIYHLVADGKEDRVKNPSRNGKNLAGVSKLSASDLGNLFFTKTDTGYRNWSFSLTYKTYAESAGKTLHFATSSGNGVKLVSENGENLVFSGESFTVPINGVNRTVHKTRTGEYYYEAENYSGGIEKVSGYDLAVTATSATTGWLDNASAHTTKSGISYNEIVSGGAGKSYTYYDKREERDTYTHSTYDVTYKYGEVFKSGTTYSLNTKDYSTGTTIANGIKNSVGSVFRVYTNSESGYKYESVTYHPRVRKYVSWHDGVGFGDKNLYYYYYQICPTSGCQDKYILMGSEEKSGWGGEPSGFPDISLREAYKKNGITDSPEGNHGEYTDGTNGVKTSSPYYESKGAEGELIAFGNTYYGTEAKNEWVSSKNNNVSGSYEKTVYNYASGTYYKNHYNHYKVKQTTKYDSTTKYSTGQSTTIDGRTAYVTGVKENKHYKKQYQWTGKTLTVNKVNQINTTTGRNLIYQNKANLAGGVYKFGDGTVKYDSYTNTSYLNLLKGLTGNNGHLTTIRGQNAFTTSFSITSASSSATTIGSDFTIRFRDYTYQAQTYKRFQEVVAGNETQTGTYDNLTFAGIKNKLMSDFSNIIQNITEKSNGIFEITLKPEYNGGSTPVLNITNKYWDFQYYIAQKRSDSYSDKIMKQGNFTNIAGTNKTQSFAERVKNLEQNIVNNVLQADSGLKNISNDGSGASLVSTYKRTYQKRSTKTVYTFNKFVDTNNKLTVKFVDSNPNITDIRFGNGVYGTNNNVVKCSSSSNGICYRGESIDKIVSSQKTEIKKTTFKTTQKDDVNYSKTSGNVAHYLNHLPNVEYKRICNGEFDNNCLIFKSSSKTTTHTNHKVTRTTRNYSYIAQSGATNIAYGNQSTNSEVNNYYELGTLNGAEFTGTGHFSGGSISKNTSYNYLISKNRFDEKAWFLGTPNGTVEKYMSNGYFVFNGNGSLRTELNNLKSSKYYIGFTAYGSGSVKVNIDGVEKTFNLTGNANAYSFEFNNTKSKQGITILIDGNVNIKNIYVSSQNAYTKYADYSLGKVTNTFYEANKSTNNAGWYDVSKESDTDGLEIRIESQIIGYGDQMWNTEDEAIKGIIALKHNGRFAVDNVIYWTDFNGNGVIDNNETFKKGNGYIPTEFKSNSGQSYRYVKNGEKTKDLIYQTERNVEINFSNVTYYGTKVENVTSDGNTNNGINVSMDFASGVDVIDWNAPEAETDAPKNQVAQYNGIKYYINTIQGQFALVNEFLQTQSSDERNLYVVNENGIVSRMTDTTVYHRFLVEEDTNKEIDSRGNVVRLDKGYQEHIVMLQGAEGIKNFNALLSSAGLKLGDVRDGANGFIMNNNSSNYTLNQRALKAVYDETEEGNIIANDFNISKADVVYKDGKYSLKEGSQITINDVTSGYVEYFEGNNYLGVAIENGIEGTYKEYFNYEGVEYRIVLDEAYTTGFTLYKEYYISGHWETIDLFKNTNTYLDYKDLDISNEFNGVYEFKDNDILTYVYETGNGELSFLVENIELRIYENPNGTEVQGMYGKNINEKYFYRFELVNAPNFKGYEKVDHKSLKDLNKDFNETQTIPGTEIKVNVNTIELEKPGKPVIEIKEKFVFKNESYSIYHLKERTDDLLVKNVISLDDLKLGGEYLDYSTVDFSKLKQNGTYGLKFSGMVNYWNGTINGASIKDENNNLNLTALKGKQKTSSINFGDDEVPEFMINGVGNGAFELYGLNKVLDNGIYYEMRDIINDAFDFLSRMMNDLNAKGYLAPGDKNRYFNGDILAKTNSLMDWNNLAKGSNFANMFRNSSFLNVYYNLNGTDGDRPDYDLGQYSVNDYSNQYTEAILNQFGFIMELAMKGYNDVKDEDSTDRINTLFKDEEIEFGIGNVQLPWRKGTEAVKILDKNSYSDWNCKPVNGTGAQSGIYECTKYFDEPYDYFDEMDNLYYAIMGKHLSKNSSANYEIQEIMDDKMVSYQAFGFLLDSYLMPTYYTFGDEKLYTEKFRIKYNNLLEAVYESVETDYIFVKSDTVAGRYYIYKKVTDPSIIRNYDDNYNMFYYDAGARYESLGQYLLSFGADDNAIYNGFTNEKESQFLAGKFKVTSITDYFIFNGYDGGAKKIYTSKNENENRKYEFDIENIFTTKPKYSIAFYVGASVGNYYYDYYSNKIIQDPGLANSQDFDHQPENPIIVYDYGNYMEDIFGSALASGNISEEGLKLNYSDYQKLYNPHVGKYKLDILQTALDVEYSRVNVKTLINDSETSFIPVGKYNPETDKMTYNGNFSSFNVRTDINHFRYSWANGFGAPTGINNHIKLQDEFDEDTVNTITYTLTRFIGYQPISGTNAPIGTFKLVENNLTNDTDYGNGRTDFEVTLKAENISKTTYNYALSYVSTNNSCSEGFAYYGGKCYYKADTKVGDNFVGIDPIYGTFYNVSNAPSVIIENLPQRTDFTLSVGFRASDGAYNEKQKFTFSTGNDMVRNPYGTTLGPTDKTTFCENNICDADEILKEEYIPYDLKEWLFEKQTGKLPETVTKEINGVTYEISSKYLSKLSKNNTIEIGFALVDEKGNIFKPKISDFKLKFVKGVEKTDNDIYHQIEVGGVMRDEVITMDKNTGVFRFKLNQKEIQILKNEYNEKWESFVNGYIFKNYVIEVDDASAKNGGMNLQTAYTLKAMSYHDEMWSYLDYNQNGQMDKNLDAKNTYYNQNGEITHSEDVSRNMADVSQGLDNSTDNINAWFTSQISTVNEFKMFRVYNNKGYKYYIMGYNRNNGSNIIK